jgi:DNA anti-recombination protein RmuC
MSIKQRVFKKLAEETKVELSAQKVELARKAPAVLKDFNKLNDKLKKAEGKISNAFNSYRKAWQDFQDILDDVAGDRSKLENDVAEINQAAMDLGVSFDSVDGLKKANDSSRMLDGLIPNLRRLYDKPK